MTDNNNKTSAATQQKDAHLLHLELPIGDKTKPLRELVRDAVEDYFAHLDGHPTSGLYRMVLDEVEQPLFETVLRQTNGNYSRAAEILGINRATLRKKLKQYAVDADKIADL